MKKKQPSIYGSNGFLMIIALAVVLIFVGILLAKGVNKKLDELSAGNTQQTSETIQTQETQSTIQTQTQQSQTITQEQTSQTISFPSSQEITDPFSGSSSPQFTPTKPLVVDGKDRVKYRIELFQKLATQPLKFQLFDESGRELTPQLLQTYREHKVHFYLVSANLKEYLHLYPEYANGVWNVKAYMPTPGTYYSYINIAPIKGQALILRNELIVRNPTEGTPDYPPLSTNGVAFTAGHELKLSADSMLEKRSNVFSFLLTQNGQTVPNVQPYNGAYGHVMVFKQENPSQVFPLTALASTDEANGRFDFMAAFSEAGRYSAFVEFFVGQRLLIFTLTFDVDARSS